MSKIPKYNTKSNKSELWNNSAIIPSKNPDKYRADVYGTIITKKNSDIDHIKPKKLGGSDHINNLQLLHRSTNRSLGATTENKKSRHDYSDNTERNILAQHYYNQYHNNK